MPSSELHIVLTYVSSHDHATAIVTALLNEQLIACANIAPSVESHYIWQNKRCSEQEIPIWIKTLSSTLGKALKRLSELHPYEVPAILSWQAHANSNYISWAHSTISNS